MISRDPALPGPVRALSAPPDDVAAALAICVALGALAPQPTVERFLVAGLGVMADHFGANGGYLGLATRRDREPDDPVFGWRLDVYYSFGGHFVSELTLAEQLIQSESYIHDAGIQATVRDAGEHRVYHDPDPRTQPTRARSLDAEAWDRRGIIDRLKLVYALEPTLELHFAFDRATSASPFQDVEVARLQSLVGGLEPWCRRVALLHGRPAHGTWLSPRERDLACLLLGHAPLKNVADELGMSEARARELARSVYKKLGVDGRLGLTRAWTGDHTPSALHPISAPLRRRRRG